MDGLHCDRGEDKNYIHNLDIINSYFIDQCAHFAGPFYLNTPVILCIFRHPIPDYYSITLEISRDRITTAQSIKCDSKDPKTLPCPAQYSNGDTYLDRSLNDACQKMVS